MGLSRSATAALSAMMAALLCVTLLSSFSSQEEDDYLELESAHKTQLYDGGWEDDLEKQNAIALKTFLGSKDPDVNATVFLANTTTDLLKNESSVYAQDMNIVQDEMDKEIAEFKFQFSKPSEYDDAEPADGAEAPAE